MRLSLLDRSRTRTGHTDASALDATLERAVHAEAAGFDRFWVAEHHGVPGIASGSPAVLLAALGARTSRIRIGSGGVMLPLHQPLVVAEQMLVLEALYPGRVDVGIGRSLGFTSPVRRALRRELEDPDIFEGDIQELRGYLDGRGPVTARPAVQNSPPLYLLATGKGIDLASRLGLSVVVGGPVLDSDELPAMLTKYRREFRPYGDGAPTIVLALDVTVADDDATAKELALPEAWAMARARQLGEFPPLDSVEEIRSMKWSGQMRSRVETTLDHAAAGSPATVRRHLDMLVERTGADELMASTSTHDRGALLASDRALRELMA